jgi:hypothetical protein
VRVTAVGSGRRDGEAASIAERVSREVARRGGVLIRESPHPHLDRNRPRTRPERVSVRAADAVAAVAGGHDTPSEISRALAEGRRS